jgi:hypothetical protein
LRINDARNCTVKVQVARQISGRTRRECGINVKTVPGSMIMKLRNVHLCGCCVNCAQNGNARFSNDERIRGNSRFHKCQSDSGALPSTTPRCLLVKHRGGPTHLANLNRVRLPCLWPGPLAHCFSHDGDGPPGLFRRGRQGRDYSGYSSIQFAR